MNNIEDKAVALEQKNRELEERKRQIEEELQMLNEGGDEQDIQFGGKVEEEAYDQEQEQEKEGSGEGEKDIIEELQAVRKATEERNQAKLVELKKRFEKNKGQLLKNSTKLQKLESNIEQANLAVKMKNELKRDLEGKGKKISDESKKWINQISKLNDKHEDLKKTLANLTKDEESAKNQHSALERRLAEINKEKMSYEAESKTLNGRLDHLKVEIESGKQVIKEKDIVHREESLKQQKSREKMQMNQKRLERQKNELIKAYKKLGQYISLLRKTNTHLQTANSLDFSLKEYLQAIDKTDIIPA